MSRVIALIDGRAGRRLLQIILIVTGVLSALLIGGDSGWQRHVGASLLVVTMLTVAKLLLMTRQHVQHLDHRVVPPIRSRLDRLGSEQAELKQTIERGLDDLRRQHAEIDQLTSEIVESVAALKTTTDELLSRAPQTEHLALLAKQAGPAFALIAVIENELMQLRSELQGATTGPTKP